MYLCQPKYDITHVVAHIECEFCCTSMKEGHKCLFNLEITAVCYTTDGSDTHEMKKQFQWHSCLDQKFSDLPGIIESFNGTHEFSPVQRFGHPTSPTRNTRSSHELGRPPNITHPDTRLPHVRWARVRRPPSLSLNSQRLFLFNTPRSPVC